MADEFDKEKQKQVKDKFKIFSKGKYSKTDLNTVLNNSDAILEKSKSKSLFKFFDDIKILCEMVKAYVSGEYREIPVKTIGMIILTLVYVFSPVDVIPDVVPVFGLVDDATMVGFCLKAALSDLQDFKEWKKNQENK